jgi:hypothetical protein
LEAGAHRIYDGVHHVLTAGEVCLEKNLKYFKNCKKTQNTNPQTHHSTTPTITTTNTRTQHTPT